ncbi:ankyrin repeat and MYND domain-containing protein 1 isoform X2 [Poecilia reticulata]|uniref:ankyrin repeat and MYND domain-containing protein 1 isoform X2 n=1 Tax=Poecilia reticulata TaxID=8081 RepID=UPI0004A28383|nr:PREDICTED: ankyrin repeat and MYND domain-containing protein 1 isoform X2 [Poecilia reticulata]
MAEMPSSSEGVPDTDGEGGSRGGSRVAVFGEVKREGFGVQEWPDGSKYEGEFLDDFKHGKGRYSWKNGELYEGFFYKDFKHGVGAYSWPSGHKFIGKFYLNRKEGYGCLNYPGGAIFQGLYHSDHRFGPGVLTYPDGYQDVGLWIGQRLLKLCSSLEEGFSLLNFPDYAAFMRSSHREHFFIKSDVDEDLLSDESFIYPPGIERYSTDGDHLPLPPGRKRELDQVFHGEKWEPDARPYRGYKRDPFSAFPVHIRMKANIREHRLQTETVDWNVTGVLSLNGDSFALKGPLEVNSELLIQHSFRGELRAVSQILQNGAVYPDVADARGQTALIAATVNCNNDVIHLLLDGGADIDKMNNEGMSALAVCLVLYYPFESMLSTLIQPPTDTPVSMSPPGETSSPINQADVPSKSLDLKTKSHITGMDQNQNLKRNQNMTNQSSLSQLTEQASEEPPVHVSHGQNGEIPADSEQLQEERKATGMDEGYDATEKSGDEQSVREDVESGLEKLKDELNRDVENLTESENREVTFQELGERISLGSGQDVPAEGGDHDLTPNQSLDSTCSIRSSGIAESEETLQQSAELLTLAKRAPQCDSEEIIRKMTLKEIEPGVRLTTLKLLLDRGADPNCCRVPMPVLFLPIMAGDTEVVHKLLMCGARTDIRLPMKNKGFYPLHVAAALHGSEGAQITEMLLHAVTEPDSRACDQEEIYQPDLDLMADKEWKDETEDMSLRDGGRTALHIACQRDGDYSNACKVVELLLSHGASTDLLWSGHSPLSLAIASGNDEAVEEILKAGADPNLPLGRRVGSALCALANFNYRLGGDRIKVLELLAKAGANILMQVPVGEGMGMATDFAYHSFQQDVRFARTPFHALNMQERALIKNWRHLLSLMAKLLRKSAALMERKALEQEQHLQPTDVHTHTHRERERATGPEDETPSKRSIHGKTPPKPPRLPAVKFCYHCGRSVFVKLAICGRCQRVYYCSKSCKMKSWDENHKEECLQMAAYIDAHRKRSSFKPRKPKTVTIIRYKPEPPKPLTKLQQTLENQIYLKENYSHI